MGEDRLVKIENILRALTENMVAAEAVSEKRQADWEKRQDRLEQRVDRFARAGLRAVSANRKEHDVIFKALADTTVRLSEITEKLDALIDIEQRRQPPQQ